MYLSFVSSRSPLLDFFLKPSLPIIIIIMLFVPENLKAFAAVNSKERFARAIKIMFPMWTKYGMSSGDCKASMDSFLSAWQIKYPLTNHNAFYTSEHFQGVMNVLQDPMSCLDSLRTIHDIVFPEQEPDFRLYYTSEQVEALTEVLLPITHRIVYLREPVVVVPAADPAPVPTMPMVIDEEILIMPIVKKIKCSVIDMITEETDQSLMRGETLDSNSVLAHARNLGNLVDMRASLRAEYDEVPDFGFFPSPDDVQFNHDLERAMAASMRDY